MADNQPENQLHFARARNDANEKTELRVDMPKGVIAVIDAHWMVRGGSRASVVNDVMGKWAALELHAATVTTRVAAGNPDLPDTQSVGA